MLTENYMKKIQIILKKFQNSDSCIQRNILFCSTITIGSIWVNIKLNTAGIYNIETLREGKDFISDLIVLFENMEKEESFLDLKQALKPVFETWQGKKYFNDLSDKEIKNILSEAKSLCLDKLLK